jgi:hypothetical protein
VVCKKISITEISVLIGGFIHMPEKKGEEDLPDEKKKKKKDKEEKPESEKSDCGPKSVIRKSEKFEEAEDGEVYFVERNMEMTIDPEKTSEL